MQWAPDAIQTCWTITGSGKTAHRRYRHHTSLLTMFCQYRCQAKRISFFLESTHGNFVGSTVHDVTSNIYSTLFCSCLTHQQPPNDQLKTHKRRWVPILQMQNTRCWFTLNNSGNILRWLIKREVLLTVNGAASFEGDKCVCLAVYRKITPLVMWSFSVNTFLISITRFSF